MLEEAAQKVAKALNSLPFVEVVQIHFKSDQLGYTCRIDSEADATKIMYQLLTQEQGWQSHLCKKFFMRGPYMKFGWNFSFRADDILIAAERICRVIQLYNTQYVNVDPLEEEGVMLLPGGLDRNAPTQKGRGVREVRARG